MVQQVQQSLMAIAQGDLSSTILLKGYMGGLLKALQSNLRHVIWKARQIADNDFSQQIDFMGEISEVFNTMGRELGEAQEQLRKQKDDLALMAENLRREVDARILVEARLRREEARLRKYAAEDPLTGLANRRSFFALARKEAERMRRTGKAACLAMLDIDNFKTLNDTFGHRQGDNALRRLTKLITTTIRPYDIAGRYGGDEFMILFPETKPEIALAILERLRAIVEKTDRTVKNPVPDMTISAGISAVDLAIPVAQVIDQAVSAADKALYQSKLAGRNCISLG